MKEKEKNTWTSLFEIPIGTIVKSGERHWELVPKETSGKYYNVAHG